MKVIIAVVTNSQLSSGCTNSAVSHTRETDGKVEGNITHCIEVIVVAEIEFDSRTVAHYS